MKILANLKELNALYGSERFRIEIYDDGSCNLYDFISGYEHDRENSLDLLEKEIERLKEDYKNIDFLENYHLLPEEVRDILLESNENEDYETCKETVKKLEAAGYTANYDLSGTLFDLTKIQ